MSESDPTPGELMRRVEQVALQMTALVGELRADRLRAEELYVRKETYIAHREADVTVVKDIRTDLAAQATFRRQIILAGGLGVIGWLITIAIAISNLLAR